MRARYWLPLRFRSLFSRRRLDAEMEAELAFHLDQLTARYEGQGLPPEEARRRARREFGCLEPLKETCRDMRRIRPLEDFAQDLLFALRLLRRTPLVTAVAVLSLALGVGANTGIFSLFHTVVLRPLPVPEPHQLYAGEFHRIDDRSPRFSYPVFEQARDALTGNAELAAMSSNVRMQVVVPGATADRGEGAGVQLVSGEWFQVLRQEPQHGRLLTTDDNRTLGGHPVAVISDGFWARRFDRDPAVVGRELLVNGVAFTVVGVTRPGFFGAAADERPDLWIPVMMQPAVRYSNNASISNGEMFEPWPPQPTVSWLTLLARLEDPAAVAVSTERLTAALHEQWAHHPANREDADLLEELSRYRTSLVPAHRGVSEARAELAAPLLVLWLMVTLLLAIACANVASLLLARATARQRELQVRTSLGAGRGRLVRQLLSESLLLSLLGGAAGLLLARWTVAGLLSFLSSGAPGIDGGLVIDARTLAYTGGLAIACGLLFGLVPALQASRVQPGETLQSRAPAGGSRPGGMAWDRLLVAGQVALSLLLVVVAGLFARSLQRLARVDVGLDRDGVVMVRMDPSSSGYTTAQVEALRRRVAALPGIEEVSLSAFGTLGGSQRSSSFVVEGHTPAPGESLVLSEEYVSEEYFRTLGFERVRGRFFEPSDYTSGRPVSVINETMANALFPGGDALGRRWDYDDAASEDAYEIVGVVRDVRHFGLRSDVPFMAYRPAIGDELGRMGSLEIKSALPARSLIPVVRDFLRQQEAGLLVTDISTLDERVGRQLEQERAVAALTSAFGSLALLLACVGLYGTLAYAVARRTHEIGVRLALGAERGAILGMVMGDALRLVAVGVAVGLPLALLSTYGIRSLLYATAPTDFWTWAGGLGVLVAVGALAALAPAWRAVRVDPLLVLRQE